MEIPTDSCASFSRSEQISGRYHGNRCSRLSPISITVLKKHGVIEPPTNFSIITLSRLWRNNCNYYLNSRWGAGIETKYFFKNRNRIGT